MWTFTRGGGRFHVDACGQRMGQNPDFLVDIIMDDQLGYAIRIKRFVYMVICFILNLKF